MPAFRCEYVRCCNPRCKSCPHGPYWYAYWREGKRVRKKYHGRTDPRPPSSAAEKAQHDRRDAIFCKDTASVALAMEILGVRPGSDYMTCRRAYLHAVKTLHPDRGGNATDFQHAEAAWSYLKGLYDWR